MSNTSKIVYDEKNKKVILSGKNYTLDQILNYSKLFLVFGILLLLIGFFVMPIGVLFIILGLYVLLQSIAYNSCAKTLERKISTLEKESLSNSEIQSKKNNYEENAKSKTLFSPMSTDSKNDNVIKKFKTEILNVAGTSYRQKDIESLKIINDDFTLSKKDIIDLCMEDEKIYQYSFRPKNVQLIEEPDNKYDPNAIQVVIDGVHVGYIKKESCLHIKELIKANKINQITADIHGGKYKIVVSDYDLEKDKEIYSIKRNETNYFVVLTIEFID